MALTSPRNIFIQPDPQTHDTNPDYWDAYVNAIPRAMMLTFWVVPKGKETYNDWWLYVKQFFKPPAYLGFPSDANDGWNDCFCDAALYLWLNDPKSPHLIGG